MSNIYTGDILVVDDQPDNLRVLSTLLKRYGYKVRRVINGQLALNVARIHPPELILLDIMMPGMNGYEVCRCLRAEKVTSDIPVIFLSALNESFDKVRAFEVGGVDYITKPFQWEEVLARINNQLKFIRQKKQLLDEIESRKKVDIELRENEQKYRDLVETSQNIIWSVDCHGKVTFINEASNLIYGYSPGEVLGKKLTEFCLESYVKKDDEMIQDILSGKKILHYETIHVSKTGRQLYMMLNGMPIQNTIGQITGAQGTIYDFTYLKQSELWQQMQSRVLTHIISGHSIRQILTELTVQVQQIYPNYFICIFLIRKKQESLYLLTTSNPIQSWISSLKNIAISLDSDPAGKSAYLGERVVVDDLGENTGLFCSQRSLLFHQVKACWSQPFFSDRGKVLGVLSIYLNEPRSPENREVEILESAAKLAAIAIEHKRSEEELKQANEKLQRLANLDGLTQVANRYRFDEYLLREWRKIQREQQFIALILLDIDYFKLYNDTYGHLAGDDCLKSVAQAISRVVKQEGSLVCRYGGEEFAVILPNTNLEHARQTALLIQQAIENLKIPHKTSEVSDYITVSLGVTSFIPSPGLNPETLIHTADLGLYRAKAQGRNQVAIMDYISES